MKAHVCVTKVVQHIIKESAEHFKGTVHEKDWFFYHDALSLMTAADTIAWMKKQIFEGKTYYDRWVLPLHGLNDIKEMKINRYAGRPVGNSPEMMPLDNSLNKDIHDSVDFHCLLTNHLQEDNIKKFSMATPKQGTSAYCRLIDPVDGLAPPPHRIVQDCEKVLRSLKAIYDVNGAIVTDENRVHRPGNRHTAIKNNHGGVRKRKLAKDDYGDLPIHKDAQECPSEKIEISKAKMKVPSKEKEGRSTNNNDDNESPSEQRTQRNEIDNVTRITPETREEGMVE